MAVLVGIDEAGFGPILGPLVVSSTSFEMPKDMLAADLWGILRKSAAKKRKALVGRLLIADSKKAYSRSSGIKHLERTVLACLNCLDKHPSSLAELFKLVCPDCFERLDDYPWYENVGTQTITSGTSDIQIAANVFADDMASNHIKLLSLRSFCLDVGHYNKLVANVKNKANVLFSVTASLIKEAFDNFGDDDLQIITDRQGGRVHYRKNLQRMFPQMQLKIISETPKNSSYELQTGNRQMRLHFAVGADDRFLPVSLASMLSKYLRELLVAGINRYFIEFHTDLKPTAGYWQDGLRFIEDLKTNIPHVDYDKNLLVRSR